MRLRSVFFPVLASLSVLLIAPLFSHAQANPQDRAALQAELTRIEQDIASNQGTLNELKTQHASLDRDIAILDNKIKTAQLQIKQTDLALRQLQANISDKQSSIVQVDGKVAMGQRSLAQMLRETREIDDISGASLLLSSDSLSDVFRQIDDFQTVQRALGNAFTEMASLRNDLTVRKQALEEQEDEVQKVREAQVIARQSVEKDQKERQTLLNFTKGREKTYQQMIADKQQQAAAIRTALFGLRDTGAIPFGTAYEYAKQASAASGVRPALILAILSQESDLGQNVGSCFVKNLGNGSGVGKNTGRFFSNIMKAPRDTVPFQEIASTLGIDWANTPVSCPQSVGYGGAMGPAQFIPSTWMLYKDRLSGITGEGFPDPWKGRTAIFATALLMKDNGADGGTRAAERKAALKYFAGANWYKAANAIYGDSVMDHADDIQAQIDVLNS